MAPVGTMRKVLGMVKDQTSISLARVASSRAPELDIVLVKATSHDDVPADEKHVLEILHLTSYSRGYVNACIEGLAKRLGKTRNWIVAIKVLMLVHRLLKDGDPSFEDELVLSRRILNVSYFRDDSHSSAWDYSAFVRTYGMYLSESLDSYAPNSSAQRTPSSHRDEHRSSYSEYRSDFSSHRSGYEYKSEYSSHRSGYGSSGYEDERRQGSPEKQKPNQKISFKDMTSDMLLERIPSMQRILERALACRPTGAAKHHRLVMISLCCIVRDSFQIYRDICDGITTLLDGFYDMQQHKDCVKIFDIYARSAKQFDELSSFYKITKNMGVCRTSEYPSLQKVSQEHLATLEEFLRDPSRSSLRSQRPKSPEPVSELKEKEPETGLNNPAEKAPNTVLALPAPPVEHPGTVNDEKEKNNADLITFDEPTASVEEHENKLALALFSSTSPHDNMGSINSSSRPEATSQGSRNVSGLDNSENGKAGWELALVSEASNMTKEAGSMAGGFNRLLLESMYDQAASNQQYATTFPAGSASSVALPGMPQSSLLALPAPVALPQDPFAASAAIAPPSYVQATDLRQKQHLLMQEQKLWQQYQTNGMQGTYGVMQLYNNPYPTAAAAAIVPQHPLNLPYYGVNSVVANRYAYY
ncbi:hypothetical protein O6H91_16G060300 [Diphasiastrum complanatum]|uniref:Uncharacterized protein n=1 Tax=Diphasiastrum complanatum TaxID=34168 RepID=A0ACC2BCT7_DIPCM|nr:hypothetical protein O6H91_16G060300 [Diphasiastrum complanatum]